MNMRAPFRCTALLLSFAVTPVWALTEVTETVASGAHIRMAAPDGWEAGDGLVLYQHGFNMEFDADPDLGPIRDRQLADGYAIAASGYRGKGWALFNTTEDNRDLLARFSARFGVPGHIITMGGSMGGLIAHKLAEEPGFEAVTGVYSLCPPAAGTRTWDTAFDLRMAYDAVCEGVGGGELPNGAEPYPWAYNLNDIPDDIGDLLGTESLQQTIARITQCTGVTLNPLLRTPPQKERLQRLMDFGAFDNEDFFLTNLAYATYALSDLLRAPDKLAEQNPFTTRGVDYGSELIQSRVPVIDADAAARLDFRRSTDLFGNIGAHVKMVSLHTSRDELVRPAHQQFLRDTFAPAQLLSAIVDEDEPSHCGFTVAEVSAGWNVLSQALVPGSTAPTSFAQLNTQCTSLVTAGVEGPCRFDAAIDPGQVVETMRPRANQNPTTDIAALNISGAWYDPQRSGEGLLIETLQNGQALVIWFTYPPAGQGEQAWMLGVGDVVGHGIVVDEMTRVDGARFGAAFNPQDVRRTPWGRLELAVQVRPDVPTPVQYPGASQLQMTVDYQGPQAWGSGRHQLQQLLEIGVNPSLPTTPSLDPRPWQHSGTFYDPLRSGEGFQIQEVRLGNGEWLTSFTWFTFNNSGQPMWLVGVGTSVQGVVEMDLLKPVGTQFGTDFSASEVVRAPWGRATLRYDGCERAQLQWQALDPTYGSGTLNAQRLTVPTAVQPCRPE